MPSFLPIAKYVIFNPGVKSSKVNQFVWLWVQGKTTFSLPKKTILMGEKLISFDSCYITEYYFCCQQTWTKKCGWGQSCLLEVHISLANIWFSLLWSEGQFNGSRPLGGGGGVPPSKVFCLKEIFYGLLATVNSKRTHSHGLNLFQLPLKSSFSPTPIPAVICSIVLVIPVLNNRMTINVTIWKNSPVNHILPSSILLANIRTKFPWHSIDCYQQARDFHNTFKD